MKRGFTAGAFDLLHPGQIKLLYEAKINCDELIVGLHVDPSLENTEKNIPVQTVYERFVQLAACKYVDAIIPYQTERDLVNILVNEEIDIRFLGTDYEFDPKDVDSIRKKIIGKNLVPIKYLSRKHDYSSSELRERLKK